MGQATCAKVVPTAHPQRHIFETLSYHHALLNESVSRSVSQLSLGPYMAQAIFLSSSLISQLASQMIQQHSSLERRASILSMEMTSREIGAADLARLNVNGRRVGVARMVASLMFAPCLLRTYANLSKSTARHGQMRAAV